MIVNTNCNFIFLFSECEIGFLPEVPLIAICVGGFL